MIFRLNKSERVVLMSDIHIGADDFDETRFLETLRYCKDTSSMIALGGDVIENSIVEGKSPGDKLLEQKYKPTEQMLYAMAAFKPFAKTGKILWSLLGNHEARSRRESLIDLSALLAEYLDIPYLGIGGMIQVISGAESYLGAVQHGAASGSNTWAELDKMSKIYRQAEFVALGHDHQLTARSVGFVGVDEKVNEVIKSVLQIRTGTYLRYAEYARKLLCPPTSVGSPILRFFPKKHHILVDVTTLNWIIE
jgi:hypothetical protein